jgi:diguanylate cyclase (GGDEF)-like protein
VSANAIPAKAVISRRDLGRTITQNVEARPETRNRELLVRMDSASAGEVIPMGKRAYRVGRHPESELCVDDQGLSRHHARFTRIGDQYWLEDLASSNGTFVNGNRISGHELKNGDTVQFGPRVCFRFSVASHDEEQMLRQLYESSVRDPMTAAYNRAFFANQLESELSFALRHKSDLSVLLFDVDHFKPVNDTHGHLAGDAVLKEIARIVQFQLRREDLFARYGGEEFVVLLRGVAIEGAASAAERLRNAVGFKPVVFEGVSIPVAISVGCASLACCNNQTAEGLVQRADGRLYQAKRDGRNRSVWTD